MEEAPALLGGVGGLALRTPRLHLEEGEVVVELMVEVLTSLSVEGSAVLRMVKMAWAILEGGSRASSWSWRGFHRPGHLTTWPPGHLAT